MVTVHPAVDTARHGRSTGRELRPGDPRGTRQYPLTAATFRSWRSSEV